MGSREDYTECMKPHMRGGGPDRKERFCKGAKICSGKAKTDEEAARLCAEAAANPKQPKAKKGSPKAAACDVSAITECMLLSIDFNAPKLRDQITEAVAACVCDKPVKQDKKGAFMSQYGFAEK